MGRKPVKCGCGGEAEIFHIAPEGYEGSYCVRCMECLTQTPFFNKDKDKAIEAWNRAMGATDMNVGGKDRTAKVDRDAIFPVTVCGACHSTVAYPNNYCSDCGVKLDWRENE